MRLALIALMLLIAGCTAPATEMNTTENATTDVSINMATDTVQNDTGGAGCTCPPTRSVVCGDDGQTYENRCLAVCAGTSVVSAGPCVNEPDTPLCIDSDASDIKTAGYVSAGGDVFNDKCEGSQVKEYYCDGDIAKSFLETCPDTFYCKSGRCIRGKEKCSDTDGGNNVYVEGTVTIDSLIQALYLDKCLSDNKLREYYCEDDELVVLDVECTCRGAECVNQ